MVVFNSQHGLLEKACIKLSIVWWISNPVYLNFSVSMLCNIECLVVLYMSIEWKFSFLTPQFHKCVAAYLKSDIHKVYFKLN